MDKLRRIKLKNMIMLTIAGVINAIDIVINFVVLTLPLNKLYILTSSVTLKNNVFPFNFKYSTFYLWLEKARSIIYFLCDIYSCDIFCMLVADY